MKKKRSNDLGRCQVTGFVKALFLDYDGTIGPLNVLRSKSTVPPKTRRVLCEINKRIPVAVITTKDLSFVVKRTPFARAWSGIGGLEMKIGDVVTSTSCLKEKMPYVKAALQYAKALLAKELTVEEKQDWERTTIAFSVDWREVRDRSKAAEMASNIISYCKALPLFTIQYEGQPFFDVFPCPIDKGKALLELKRKLELHDGVLYMGDSIVDNPAFDAADISVAVIHKQTPDNLTCDYFLKFEDVATFLQDLLNNDLCFSPRPPLILHRTEAIQSIRRTKPT